ncbi:MAG: radical SAM protein [Planctomycetota bacterium]
MKHINALSAEIVEVPTIMEPIQSSPGFQKKNLSDYKLDICGLCQFGCMYCSSPHGNYLRINRKPFADLTEKQTGERTLPADAPNLMFAWPDVLENLTKQLRNKEKSWGLGQTLVFSMLTDGFSPMLVKDGTTKAALAMVLDQTSFRIRVLTKNSIVGSKPWIDFFLKYSGRFVVGLSIGTLDNGWAKMIETKTSLPTARIRAMNNLQDAGVPTFGMLCPVFPHVLEGDGLDRLVDAIRPSLVEQVWAEPYNDRANWMGVHDACLEGGADRQFLIDVYGAKKKKKEKAKATWSRYATDLYTRLRRKAEDDGWMDKFRYLLYEDKIVKEDASAFHGLVGVLLQSKPDENGKSQNAAIAALQA